MKSLFFAFLLSLTIPVSAQTDSTPLAALSAGNLRPNTTIALAAPNAAGETSWTVIVSPDPSVPTVPGFPKTDAMVCGLKVPAGAGQTDAVLAGWVLQVRSVGATERFAQIQTHNGSGAEITILCGIGFDPATGLFGRAPSRADFDALMSRYFSMNLQYNARP